MEAALDHCLPPSSAQTRRRQTPPDVVDAAGSRLARLSNVCSNDRAAPAGDSGQAAARAALTLRGAPAVGPSSCLAPSSVAARIVETAADTGDRQLRALACAL